MLPSDLIQGSPLSVLEVACHYSRDMTKTSCDRTVETASVEQSLPHRRVKIGDVELGCEQIAVDIGKAGKVFIKLGLTLFHGRIQHLEQPCKPTAEVGTVLASPGFK